MKAHVIENGKIVNTIVVDSLNSLPGVTLVEAVSGTRGDIWDGSKPVKPPKWVSVEEAKADVGSKIDALRIEKTFTDVNVTFPSGEKKDIQFRSEFDMSNLLSVAMAGLALIVSGKQNDTVVYRTKDNVTHALKAVEMVGIGMAVMAAKQAIVSAAWTHKDAIKNLETIEALDAYDISTGWPV